MLALLAKGQIVNVTHTHTHTHSLLLSLSLSVGWLAGFVTHIEALD